MEILHEGVFDKTLQFEGRTISKATFWFTRNILPHPVTEGVRALCLPLHGADRYPGVVAIKYSPEWKIIVRGEKEAKSYRSGLGGHPNILNTNAEGTYPGEPPVVAVRQFGEGRIVSYPISSLFTGINYGKRLWSHTVQTRGAPLKGIPSDSLKLQINAYRWLAEPALKKPDFGTFDFKPYKPVQFPPSVHFDREGFPRARSLGHDIRGIAGLHSNYSDGKSTVDEYAGSAKSEGLSFIVFADPLEKLMPQKLRAPKKDCERVSDSSFYACPGIVFTDGSGIRWTMWGERVVFPQESFKDGKYTYTQWDGEG